jgi:hypothetical protein
MKNATGISLRISGSTRGKQNGLSAGSPFTKPVFRSVWLRAPA